MRGIRQPERPPVWALRQARCPLYQFCCAAEGDCSQTRPVSRSSTAASPITHWKRDEWQPSLPSLEARMRCQDGGRSSSDFIVEPTGPGGSNVPPLTTPASIEKAYKLQIPTPIQPSRNSHFVMVTPFPVSNFRQSILMPTRRQTGCQFVILQRWPRLIQSSSARWHSDASGSRDGHTDDAWYDQFAPLTMPPLEQH